MIAFLTAKVGARAAKLIAYVAIPLLILAAFWIAFDAYGDARFKAGEAATDLKWQEASRKLQERELKARGVADQRAADRADQYAANVAAEKEKIDEAIADGSSPFDVLFPAE